MNWHYIDTQQQQIGPINDSELENLISKGTLKKETMVWNESMTGWISVAQTPLATFFPPATPPSMPPPIAPKPHPTASFASSAPDPSVAFGRDDTLVYPTNPPRSPRMAWLNLIGPGLAQIVFGKTWFGVAAIGAFTLLSYFDSLIQMVIGDREPSGLARAFLVLLFLLMLAILIASIVDAYMTGNRLREGQPVGKWQVFPRKSK